MKIMPWSDHAMRMSDLPLHWALDFDGDSGLEWGNDVMSAIWKEGNYLTRNENDEIICIDGLMGSCFNQPVSKERLGYHLDRM